MYIYTVCIKPFIMKTILKSLMPICLLALFASSCGQDADSIPGRCIIKQANAELKHLAKDRSFVSISVGKFECNDDEIRNAYRMMEAAGLVTYDVTRYAWWEKTQEKVTQSYQVPSYIWGYYVGTETKYKTVNKTVYDFQDHYIVNISLTKKGERYVVDELPVPEEEVDKDMKQPEIDPSDYAWNKTDLSEVWPDIENPFLEKEEPAASEPGDPAVEDDKDSSTPRKKSGAADEPKVERIDSLQYEAYRAFVPSEEEIDVKAFETKVVKARNIKVYEKEGAPFASAEIITKVRNTTDFGRILNNVENGMKVLGEVEFEYFQDKGWRLLDSSFDVSD